MAKIGRPRMIESAEILEDLFWEYWEWAEKNPLLVEDYVGKDATMVMRRRTRPKLKQDFQIWLRQNKGFKDVSRYLYPKGDSGHKEFVEVSTRIDAYCTGHNVPRAMIGEYQQNIVARMHGLADNHVNTNIEQPLFPDELDKSKIASE